MTPTLPEDNAKPKRKTYHFYCLSYADEVGSFDPDMEDVGGWEHELRGTTTDVPAKSLPF